MMEGLGQKNAIELMAAGLEQCRFGIYSGLQDAAEKWAIDSLKTYRDSLLRSALGISEAIVNFLAQQELENDKH